MNGMLLYRIYVEENANKNVEVDAWEDLDEHDQAIWNAMADRLDDDAIDH